MENLDKDFKKLSLKPKESADTKDSKLTKDQKEEKKADKNDKYDKSKAPINTEKTLVTEGNRNDPKKSNYTPVKIIGNGTFGVVYEAYDPRTEKTVAIKKVFQDRRYKNRELQITKELNHPNCISMIDNFHTPGEKPDEIYLNIVMEFIPETLSRLVRFNRKKKSVFPDNMIKIYSYQMLRAIAYLEGVGICHRDIKPQNVLINPATKELKICDFGSAKKLVKGEPNIAYICSRYYRAPELIFGATEYTSMVDVWSIGCVIAEMILNEPLFAGDSSIDQLIEIIKTLGTPTKEQVLKMNPNYKEELKIVFLKQTPWEKVFGKKCTDPLLFDLIDKLLVYNPQARLKPIQALAHEYFDELRSLEFVRENGLGPEFFQYTKEEIFTGPNLKDKLIPDWMKKSK